MAPKTNTGSDSVGKADINFIHHECNRDVSWFGLVWFGLVWFGLVWFGLVWFGLVWFGLGWDGSGRGVVARVGEKY